MSRYEPLLAGSQGWGTIQCLLLANDVVLFNLLIKINKEMKIVSNK
jgi:hypothetical protein